MTATTHLGAGEWTVNCGATSVRVRRSTVADGDFHIESDRSALLERRQRFVPGVWTQLDEVHGTDIRWVTRPGDYDFAEGDAAATDAPGAVLAVWVGDCAAIVVVGDSGQFAVVHAGWRGARDGVVARTVEALRAAGAGRCEAVLLSAIGPCCYEFGADDLEVMEQRFGMSVRAVTTDGSPSLSMPAVVAAECARLDVPFTDLSGCTRCTSSPMGAPWFSHRRGDRGRHVVTAALCGQP
jgi:copper oxidase (laccase) domain-containing protein